MQHTTTRDECYYRSPTEPGVNSRGPLVSHVENLRGRTGAVRININNEQRRHSVRRYYLCEARLIWPRGTTTTPRAVRVFLADPGVRLAGGPCTECRQRRQPALRHLRCQLLAVTNILADPHVDTIDDDPTVDPPRYLSRRARTGSVTRSTSGNTCF
ncbi:hypothetical protein GOALK_030_00420 [Gordonia alkanivorans NBRC 16433]|uniref:Uncharacterized protein n=1 Tax=Gordonia alkanivorans NBRC 16433 TaxID=1027371 RepID=F9VS56_9ACTN|nr:hypothetical protein GOALK_030_00420 [Gordonia alkanivorans NBRC 16433]